MRQRLAPFLLTGLCLLMVSLLAGTELCQKGEFYLSDLRFALRSGEETPSSEIRLITINERTGDAFPEHDFFWMKHYAQACEVALANGATAVGLDFVLTYPDPEGMEAMLRTAIAHRGKLVCGAYFEPTTGQLLAPFRKLVAAVGAENLALLNLWREFDGVTRAQPVFPIQLSALGRDSFPIFAGRLAEIHTGRKLNTRTLSFGDSPLDLLSGKDPRIRINFAARPAFEEMSLQDVVALSKSGETDTLRSFFEGHVVLLGSVRAGDKDAVETPLSLRLLPSPEMAQALGRSKATRRSSMAGVRVHAHTLQTLLSGAGVRVLPGWARLALLVVLAGVLGTPCFLTRPLAAAGLGALTVGLYWVATVTVFSSSSLLLPVMEVLLLAPLLLGVLYGYRYAFADRRRRHIQQTFSRYVAPEVMEEMLKSPQDYDPSGVSEREVTVLFSDINGFSTICEGRSATEVAQMLNEHFREMSEIIFRHQGTLIRFNGDELMVLFGAPKPLEQSEQAAVRTALDMVARLAEMEESDPTARNGFYKVKIGIHSGDMILSSIGTAKRSDYNAIGDGANLASRVMSLAGEQGVEILVSQTIRERTKGMQGVEFEERGTYPVKGREGEVCVYQPRSCD